MSIGAAVHGPPRFFVLIFPSTIPGDRA